MKKLLLQFSFPQFQLSTIQITKRFILVCALLSVIGSTGCKKSKGDSDGNPNEFVTIDGTRYAIKGVVSAENAGFQVKIDPGSLFFGFTGNFNQLHEGDYMLDHSLSASNSVACDYTPSSSGSSYYGYANQSGWAKLSKNSQGKLHMEMNDILLYTDGGAQKIRVTAYFTQR